MEKAQQLYKRLYKAAAAINSVRSTEDVLKSITENVAEAVEARGCSLMLLTPDKQLLIHTAAYGLSDWYLRKGPVSADKSIAGALEGKPVAVLNAVEDARVQYREQAKKEGIASILSVPLKLRDEIIGVVRVYTAEPRQFAEEEIEFVSAIANLGAIALENARLYDSITRDYNALKHYYFPFI